MGIRLWQKKCHARKGILLHVNKASAYIRVGLYLGWWKLVNKLVLFATTSSLDIMQHLFKATYKKNYFKKQFIILQF